MAHPTDPERSIDVSVVVPVFDNSTTLGTLVERVCEVMGRPGRTFEVILVDDGSTDDSWKLIEAAARADDRVGGIRLVSNVGGGTARAAGCSVASGRFICTIDADLDYDPIDLLRVVSLLELGNDFVSGVRVDPAGRPPLRWLGSQIMRRLVSGTWSFVPRDLGCGLQGWTGELAGGALEAITTHRDFAWAVPLFAPVRNYAEVELYGHVAGRRSSYGYLRQVGRILSLAAAVDPAAARRAHRGLVAVACVCAPAVPAVWGRRSSGARAASLVVASTCLMVAAPTALVLGRAVARVESDRERTDPAFVVAETTGIGRAGGAGRATDTARRDP